MTIDNEHTTKEGMPYWHFSSDPQGDWLDDDAKRYTANSAKYWVTPLGVNVGCPQAETEQEAGQLMKYSFEPFLVEGDLSVWNQ